MLNTLFLKCAVDAHSRLPWWPAPRLVSLISQKITRKITPGASSCAIGKGRGMIERQRISLANATCAIRPSHVPADRVVELDLYRLPGSEQDFLAAWVAFAERAPARVVWTPHNGGHWIAFGGSDIADAYSDHVHFSSCITIVPRQWGEMYPLRPTTLDPPEHQPYRRVLTSLLSSTTVRRAEPLVRAFARRAAMAVRDRGACDFVQDFAAGLPFALFAGLAGIGPERMDILPRYAECPIAEEGTALPEPVMERFEAFLRALIAEKRAESGDDIICALLGSQVHDRQIGNDEAVEIATALMTGGLDTVISTLALMIRHLAEDHVLRRRLVANPALVPTAVREMVRRFPIMTKARLVRQDRPMDGVTLKAGDMIVLPPLQGLDPAVFADPLRVDLERPRAPHATYGHGVHRCPGAQLAEMEMGIALTEWLACVPEFALDPLRPPRMQGGVLGTVVSCHLRWAPVTVENPRDG
ncbi:cytochrome P450 [Paraburkholderia domus]|uniref:cytochrome P450 n=1 Tax=Paraburkholderia domus TaxID=2793075 RepID=UPI001912011A|nr:cytochrome P450 [Paraburkholderia domus]MBK5065680.1 cytochrome P450 [Burkholderia sp. R-70199]